MTTATLYPSEDAGIHESDPDKNYGSETSMSVEDYGTYEDRAYIEFNISSIPSDVTISSAVLHLLEVFGNDRADTIRFQRTTSQFDEHTITWNSNKPSTTATNQVDASISGSGGWHTIDLTDMFRDAHDANLSYFGVYMRSLTSNGNHAFETKEGTHDPYLVVTYTITSYDEIYVKLTGNDSNDGTSWDTAKQTIKAGLETVAVNGTLHIAFGDYSSQDAITLDKTVSLLCENEGGGGTGTVVLPPTT